MVVAVLEALSWDPRAEASEDPAGGVQADVGAVAEEATYEEVLGSGVIADGLAEETARGAQELAVLEKAVAR